MALLTDIRKMYLMAFFYRMHFFGAISVPFFLEWGRLNFTLMFLLQSWFMLWIFILEIPTGVVADRIGRKHSMILSGVVLVLSIIVYTRSPDFYLFLVAEALFALAMALFSGADKAFIYDKLKDMGKEGMSKGFFANYSIAETLGIVVGLPLGSVIAGMMLVPYPDNLSFTFFLTAIPVLVSILIALILREPRKRKSEESYLTLAKQGMGYLLKHRKLRLLSLDRVLISSMVFFIYWFYQPVLGNLGVPVTYYGFVAAGFNIVSVLLISRLTTIDMKVGTSRLFLLTALLPGVLYIILSVSGNLAISLSCITVIAAMVGFRKPLFDHHINSYIRSKDRATVLSSISMMERVLIAMMYPIIGTLADASLQLTLLVLGVLTVFFALSVRSGKGIIE